MIREKRSFFFTITPDMIDNDCPSVYHKFFEEPDGKTWQDVANSRGIDLEYGKQGNSWTHKATGESVLVFQVPLPSLLGGELLEFITIMANEEMPDSNLDLVAKITDVNALIPDTVLSMYFPNTYSGGVKITWKQLFDLSDAYRADNTQPYYDAEYFEHDGDYYVNIPDLMYLVWGLFVKKGYGESSPLVAIYTTPEQLKEYCGAVEK